MKSRISNILRIGVPVAAIAMLAACGSSKPTGTNEQNNTQVSTVPQNGTVPTLSGMPAAAENLEALTEQAFTASPKELDSLFAKVQESVARISGQLSPKAAKSLDGHIQDAKAAIAAGNPSDTALAAVEGFKLIVSAYPSDAKMPAAVSLLDYSGFRIQADLKSEPKRWTDALEAAKFAHEQWDQIKGKVTDIDLRSRFTASLSSLDENLSRKDEKSAAKAAVTELELVDELEGFFQPTAAAALSTGNN
jgi:hypothetical protein